jgi:inositol-phosphate phosphatase/L-galactose 1-phosphate phosphatase/histidinol-phosphatase
MNNFLDFANLLADKASEISNIFFRKNIDIGIKGEIKSPAVTQADLTIEGLLREQIKQTYPNHSILGEEFTNEYKQSDYTWSIDPIDGTTAFTCGKPLFTTLIALLEKNKPILGLVDQPILKERWTCVNGNFTLFNGKKCSVNKNVNEKAIKLNATTPFMFNEEQFEKFKKVGKIAKIKSFGGDGYGFCLLASGFIDIIVEADLQIYDIAPIIPIIQGSGGIITDWQGKEINFNNFKGEVVCSCDTELHKKVVELLK